MRPEAGWLRPPYIGLPFARRGSKVEGGGSHHGVTPGAPLGLEGRGNTMQATTEEGPAAEGRAVPKHRDGLFMAGEGRDG